jgi:predicted amidohydrolase
MNKAIVGSVVIAERGEYFNRLIWSTPEGVATYDKRHRFRMAGEHNHYSAGTAREVFTLGEWRVCPMVCYDLRFPVWSRNRDDYDLLIYVANWPAARQTAWDVLVRSRAIENLSYLAAVNIVGIDGNGVAYQGGSGVFGPEGEVLAQAGGSAGRVETTLTKDTLERYRAAFPAWQDADEFDLRG